MHPLRSPDLMGQRAGCDHSPSSAGPLWSPGSLPLSRQLSRQLSWEMVAREGILEMRSFTP
jgi:hypothetical protein